MGTGRIGSLFAGLAIFIVLATFPSSRLHATEQADDGMRFVDQELLKAYQEMVLGSPEERKSFVMINVPEGTPPKRLVKFMAVAGFRRLARDGELLVILGPDPDLNLKVIRRIFKKLLPGDLYGMKLFYLGRAEDEMILREGAERMAAELYFEVYPY